MLYHFIFVLYTVVENCKNSLVFHTLKIKGEKENIDKVGQCLRNFYHFLNETFLAILKHCVAVVTFHNQFCKTDCE